MRDIIARVQSVSSASKNVELLLILILPPPPPSLARTHTLSFSLSLSLSLSLSQSLGPPTTIPQPPRARHTLCSSICRYRGYNRKNAKRPKDQQRQILRDLSGARQNLDYRLIKQSFPSFKAFILSSKSYISLLLFLN
jgi:hypothetical protein